MLSVHKPWIHLIATVAISGGFAACGGGATIAPSSATTPPASSSAPRPSAVSRGEAGPSLGVAAAKVGMIGCGDCAGGAHFVPAAVTVHVGDIVEWDYSPTGAVPHDVNFGDFPSLSSRTLGAKDNGDPGAGVWQVRFAVPGTFNYVCTFHPDMTGIVTVG